MAAYFTVVQYVPDPIADERINVGVIVFENGKVRSRFVKNWVRARNFGHEDIQFLRTFAAEANTLDEKKIREIAHSWNHSIRLTQPIGSLLDAGALLADTAKRYLRIEALATKVYHGRSFVIGQTERTVKRALQDTIGREAAQLVRRHITIQGRSGDREFDIGADNGRPYFAARALSFQVPDTKMLHREVESTAWAVADVHKAEPRLPLAVVVLPPNSRHNREVFDEAIRDFQIARAKVVRQPELEEWATSMASVVAEQWHGEGSSKHKRRPKSK
jgi:hypothetical protein